MITEAEAIRRVRAQCGLPEAVAGVVCLVRRLDRPASAYLLVQMGRPEARVAVATIHLHSGAVGVHARLPGTGPHLVVDTRRALELAGLGAAASVEAVWMPCSLSKSPLYPFWRVTHEGQARFVDQQGQVTDSLTTTTLGG